MIDGLTLVKFKYPTHQIVFATDMALKTFITLREAMKYENKFFPDKENNRAGQKKTCLFHFAELNTTIRFQN